VPDNAHARGVARKLASLNPTQLAAGKFVASNANGTVQIDFGNGPVQCQSASTFQPLPGDPVRCIQIANVTLMVGPTVPRSAVGTVTATGSPLITVTTSIGSKQLPYITSYTPTIGDSVAIDWASGGIVLGKTTGVPAGTYTPPATVASPHSADFAAIDSGTYYVPGSTYNNTDVWCTSTGNNIGAWFYGTTIADTIPDAAVITSVQLYIDEFFNQFPGSLALIGLHSLATKSGAPSISSPTAIPAGSGFMTLPTAFGDALKTGSKLGVGTGSTGGSGYHKFRSVLSDSQSGKLRIGWTY
jgi:hypothetical protein